MHDRINKSASVYGTFVRQVSEQSKSRGMTPIILSSESGIASERLTSILDGQSREVTLRELVGLSLALGVPLSSLLSES
jgi:hypothetical protein